MKGLGPVWLRGSHLPGCFLGLLLSSPGTQLSCLRSLWSFKSVNYSVCYPPKLAPVPLEPALTGKLSEATMGLKGEGRALYGRTWFNMVDIPSTTKGGGSQRDGAEAPPQLSLPSVPPTTKELKPGQTKEGPITHTQKYPLQEGSQAPQAADTHTRTEPERASHPPQA